jgi:hypothetical protein
MIDMDILLGLAPFDLPTLRPVRFDGNGLNVPLSHFALADAETLRHVYAKVNGLSLQWKAMGADPDWNKLGQGTVELTQERLIEQVRRLGSATNAAGLLTPETHKALHDVRGGGLTVLLGTAELLSYEPGDHGLTHTCVAAARDHAKIMRCLLPDLDPEGRAADEAGKAHGISHFVDKWQGAQMRGPDGPVVVSVHCEFWGNISARCLETAVIDRVVYNLMNNAARFAGDGQVELAVQAVDSKLTRWVVGNRVTAAEAAFLSKMDLKALFAGGVTRGGNGVGLANCAEIVADCFGLQQPTDAAQRGYVGAALHGDTFLAWFHWPSYVSHPEQQSEKGPTTPQRARREMETANNSR